MGQQRVAANGRFHQPGDPYATGVFVDTARSLVTLSDMNASELDGNILAFHAGISSYSIDKTGVATVVTNPCFLVLQKREVSARVTVSGAGVGFEIYDDAGSLLVVPVTPLEFGQAQVTP